MDMKFKLKIQNRFAELEKLPGFVLEIVTGAGIDKSKCFALNLVLEEILANTISYGYPDGKVDDIFVDAEIRNKALRVEITDMANEYNPLEAPEADITSSTMERPIGGLGIHLIKEYCSEISYTRADQKNVLTFSL